MGLFASGTTIEPTGTVTLPLDGPPTFRAEHDLMRWYLELRLDRRLKGDPAARLEIVVRT